MEFNPFNRRNADDAEKAGMKRIRQNEILD